MPLLHFRHIQATIQSSTTPPAPPAMIPIGKDSSSDGGGGEVTTGFSSIIYSVMFVSFDTLSVLLLVIF